MISSYQSAILEAICLERLTEIDQFDLLAGGIKSQRTPDDAR